VSYGAWYEVPPVERHLGNLAILQGRLEDAERHLTWAFEQTERLGLMSEHANVLVSLGALKDELRDLEGARAAVSAALTLHRRSGHLRQAGIAANNLARMHVAAGAFDRAAEAFADGIETLGRAGDQVMASYCRIQMAELLMHLRRLDEARDQLMIALPVLRQADCALHVGIATARLGDLTALEGDWTAAHHHWSEATSELASIGALREKAKVLAKQALFEAEWKPVVARRTLALAEQLSSTLPSRPDGILAQILAHARETIERAEEAN